MDRTLRTIVDVWREYDEGLPGKPPIRVLYEADAHTFPNTTAGNTERKFYNRRKSLYRAVHEVSVYRAVSPLEAAIQLDAWRCRQKNTSVNNAQKQLRDMKAEQIKLL